MIRVSVSISSSASNHTATLGIFKNPTFSGALVTGGTPLLARAVQRLANATDIQCATLETMTTLGNGDQFSVVVQDTVATTDLFTAFNLVAEVI